MKKLDELERLIVERLRLELKRCDLTDEQNPTTEVRALNEKIRTIDRMRFEIWIELIPLLRQELRIKRMTAADKKKAQLQLDRDIEKLNRKWTERTKGMLGPDEASPKAARR